MSFENHIQYAPLGTEARLNQEIDNLRTMLADRAEALAASEARAEAAEKAHGLRPEVLRFALAIEKRLREEVDGHVPLAPFALFNRIEDNTREARLSLSGRVEAAKVYLVRVAVHAFRLWEGRHE